MAQGEIVVHGSSAEALMTHQDDDFAALENIARKLQATAAALRNEAGGSTGLTKGLQSLDAQLRELQAAIQRAKNNAP